MSSASPVRRPVTAAASNVVNAPARAPRIAGGGLASGVDKADIPPLDTNLNIEGLKPSFLSRLMDMFSSKR